MGQEGREQKENPRENIEERRSLQRKTESQKLLRKYKKTINTKTTVGQRQLSLEAIQEELISTHAKVNR